eukprot:CAMPEP_0201903354 /NCGR_PEP_ID=MMETSP0902-20130614/55432_1 /ASSEMBLY_ACC=CAM_ASM_000551 /TAXON_ID=420261 /ORGANISM="Thalassiosira antarctica, Strain CCMP982" /LENGTH=31 /DNA_ID= /DNA_START= /DNA_END= /DNA_ORIENTATION=
MTTRPKGEEFEVVVDDDEEVGLDDWGKVWWV